MERQPHENMSSEERIIRIDQTVFFIKEQLADGSNTMTDHEKRIQSVEKLVPTLVTNESCVKSHNAQSKTFTGLLIALLIAAISFIAVLVNK
jgi:hypothetical protein